MPIMYGKRREVGKDGRVRQRIVVRFSDAIKNITEHEEEQLSLHGNRIFERDYTPEWMTRTCPRCIGTCMAERPDGTWKCPICRIVKIPKEVWKNELGLKESDIDVLIERRNNEG